MVTFYLLSKLGMISSILIASIFLFNYKKLNRSLKIFSIFFGLLALVNLVGSIIGSLKIHNVFLWHSFNYVELFFMTWFFLSFYNGKAKTTVKVSALLILFIMLYGSVFINTINEFNVLGFFVMKLFVIILSMIEVYKNQLVSNKHYYYLNIGTIITSIVSLCYFTFWNLRLDNFFPAEGKKVLMITNAVGFIVGVLFYLAEFYKSKLWMENR